MEVYILTSVSQDLLSDEQDYEIAEDILNSGSPHLTFEQAGLSAQSFVEDLWPEDDYPVLTLAWTDIGELPESVWTSECEEFGLQFMIRKFDI